MKQTRSIKRDENGAESAYITAGGWIRRTLVLGLLLILQSASSSVLERFEDLLRNHIEVTLFLTMLVGAGGNAGNQTTIAVIHELGRSPRTLYCLHEGGNNRWSVFVSILSAEFLEGFKMAIPLTILGGLRSYIALSSSTKSDHVGLVASSIAISLLLILLCSVVLGAVIPLTLASMRIDPTHAGPAIQVVMDVVGVLTTCMVCSLTLTGVPGVRSKGNSW